MVGHGADAANGRSGDDDVAVVQRTVLNQHSRHRAATLIQLRLDDDTLGAAVGVGLELLDLGDEQNALEQIVQTLTGQSRDGHAHHVAAPLLGNEVVFGQLLLDVFGIGRRLIHLVDGDDDIDAGRLGVVNGLDGLGHDTVVSGDDENGNVGGLRTAGAHGREGLVAGRVKEGDVLTLDLDAVRTDVLGDTAGLACGHLGVTNGVEQ